MAPGPPATPRRTAAPSLSALGSGRAAPAARPARKLTCRQTDPAGKYLLPGRVCLVSHGPDGTGEKSWSWVVRGVPVARPSGARSTTARAASAGATRRRGAPVAAAWRAAGIHAEPHQRPCRVEQAGREPGQGCSPPRKWRALPGAQLDPGPRGGIVGSVSGMAATRGLPSRGEAFCPLVSPLTVYAPGSGTGHGAPRPRPPAGVHAANAGQPATAGDGAPAGLVSRRRSSPIMVGMGAAHPAVGADDPRMAACPARYHQTGRTASGDCAHRTRRARAAARSPE